MNDFIEKPPFMEKTVCMFILGFLLGFLTCYTLPSRNDTNTTGTISAIKEQQSLIKHEIGNADNGVKSAEKSVLQAGKRIDGVQERIADSERIARQNADRIDGISKIVRECQNIAEQNRIIYEQIGEANKSH